MSVVAWDGETLGLPLTVPSWLAELLSVAEPDAVDDKDAVADTLGVHDAVTVDVCEHEGAVAPASQHGQAPEHAAVDKPVEVPKEPAGHGVAEVALARQ